MAEKQRDVDTLEVRGGAEEVRRTSGGGKGAW